MNINKNKVATIQLNSNDCVKTNLNKIKVFVNKAKQAGAELVLLPENCGFMGKTQMHTKDVAEDLGDLSGENKIQHTLSVLAKQNNIWILAGGVATIQRYKSNNEDRIYQTLLVFDNNGLLFDFYNKIHLFDVDLPNKNESYRESDLFSSDENCQLKVIKTPVGNIGLSICYDLRFPEMFRGLCDMGAEIFVMPAAFTFTTGQAHWEVLTRTRAIENQCYLIASGQTGEHTNKRHTWGHSMVISPWGKVLSCLDDGEGVVIAEIDLGELHQQRNKFPVLAHRKNGL